MTEQIAVPLTRLDHAADLPLPAYQTEGAAGCDLLAAVLEPLVLAPGARARVPTGIAIALPAGFEGQVRPRSGLADRHGLTCLNSPGTVDSDYRGELQVILINLGDQPFTITRGLRIAQLVIARHACADWRPVAALEPSRRGTGGFGSTGTGP